MADILAVAIAVSLPWSTSATAILVGLWFFTLVPVLRWDELRREILTPAGGLPVLLVLLGVAGMLWADVTLLERWKGLDSFLKLLAIPLLLVQFRQIRARKLGLLRAISCRALRSWSLRPLSSPYRRWRGAGGCGSLGGHSRLRTDHSKSCLLPRSNEAKEFTARPADNHFERQGFEIIQDNWVRFAEISGL